MLPLRAATQEYAAPGRHQDQRRPQRKPWGKLIISILIADLVFMRALWSIFTIATSSWIKSEDKTGNWCEGCLKLAALQEESKHEGDSTRYLRDASSHSVGIPLLHRESQSSRQERVRKGEAEAS